MQYDLEKISNKIERQHKIKSFLKKVFSTALIIIAIINIIFLYYNFNGEKEPNIFGIYFFNIVSGSMSPEIEINDVIIVKKSDISKLEKDDIITFLKDGKIISHRIIKKILQNDEIAFITQGDNNEVQDEGIVESEQIYGKVIFKISKLGKIVEYIQNKNGFIIIATISIIMFIFITMKDEEKNRRKKIRRKYEIKKEREKYN